MPWNEFCMIRVIWEVSDGFSREVWSSSLPSDHDLTGGGSPPPKIEKNKFVLKWFLGNFKCFKLIFFFKKKLTEQAGAELCQAQYELELLKFCLATKLDQHKLCN